MTEDDELKIKTNVKRTPEGLLAITVTGGPVELATAFTDEFLDTLAEALVQLRGPMN